MFSFTKTLAAIALGATAVAGATVAATNLGGLEMSLTPVTVTNPNPWQGYSDGWDKAAGWECFSSGGRNVILLGLGFDQPSRNDWGSITWAGCYNGWAHPFLSASKIQQADSFERRYVGIDMRALTAVR
jgi:hypothetical protein